MLGQDGLLPAGRHVVTADEFKAYFVDAFTASTVRARQYTRWLRHREALSSVIPIQTQWIDGSYVTSKIDPGDIDVVTMIDALAFDALAPALQTMVGSLLGGKNTQAIWGIDSYPILAYPGGHALQADTARMVAYWDDQWQRVKGDIQLKKGYLEVMT